MKNIIETKAQRIDILFVIGTHRQTGVDSFIRLQRNVDFIIMYVSIL